MAKKKGKNKPFRKRRAPPASGPSETGSEHSRKGSAAKKSKKVAENKHRLTGQRAKIDWSRTSLRDQPVTFIKASILDPLESLKLPAPSKPADEEVVATATTTENVAISEQWAFQDPNGNAHTAEEDLRAVMADQLTERNLASPAMLAKSSASEERSSQEPTEVEQPDEENDSSSSEEVDVTNKSTAINSEAGSNSPAGTSAAASSEDESESDDEEQKEISVYEFEGDSRLKVVSRSMSEMDLGFSSDEDGSDVDNMSELDDDQIFALARMSRNPDAYDDDFLDDEEEGNGLDDDFDDYYDERGLGDGLEDAEFDALMNDLLGDAPVNLGSYSQESAQASKSKKPLSKRRQARLDAREENRRAAAAESHPLAVKYPDVITVHDVLGEISTFCKYSKAESLAFPPLDANAIWYVKEIAGLHGCSYSRVGKDRHKSIIVTRTNRTGQRIVQGKLQRLLTRRQVFVRTDLAGTTRTKAEPTSKQTKKGPRVRDGHVVGHDAKEISEDNVGHQLMLKMGWTQGSGLGSSQAGIPQPVVATVRLTKRGLGQ